MDRRSRSILSPLVTATLLVGSGCLGELADSVSTPTADPTSTDDPPDFDALFVDSEMLFVNKTDTDDPPDQRSCEGTMADGVNALLHRRVDIPLDGTSYSFPGRDGEITVIRETTLDRDGTVVSEPSITCERLTAIIPEDVETRELVRDTSNSHVGVGRVCHATLAVSNRTLRLE